MSNNRITALPPDSEIPNDGGSYYVCNQYEWVAATLKRDVQCWYWRKQDPQWRKGFFIMSWMYDGVIAKVEEADPDDLGEERSLFLDLGDKLLTVEMYQQGVR